MPKITYKKDFNDLPDSVLKDYGIINSYEFKEELYEIFIAYEKGYSSFDYDLLKSICTNKYFLTVSNELSYLERMQQRRVLENFQRNSIIIDSMANNGHALTASAVISITSNNYIIDKNGEFVKGNKYALKTQKLNIIFSKNINDITNDAMRCPSCGAPIKKVGSTCDYCKASITPKLTWKINSINRITEEEKKQDSPIKMY